MFFGPTGNIYYKYVLDDHRLVDWSSSIRFYILEIFGWRETHHYITSSVTSEPAGELESSGCSWYWYEVSTCPNSFLQRCGEVVAEVDDWLQQCPSC